VAGELNLVEVQVKGVPVLATSADVDSLEQDLGTSLPRGYREYVTTLGEGSLDVLVRVLPPWQIRTQLEEHRSRMASYWFWGDGVESFGQDEAMESIPLADTMDGDAVAFWPADPSRLFVLPRNEEALIARPANVLELAEWICSGGLGHEPAKARRFQPWDSRTTEAQTVHERETPAFVLPQAPAPDLTRSPRDVLLAYFAELAEVEAWAGLNAPRMDDDFDGTLTPELERQLDELIARSEAVPARYGTAAFARGQRGASVASSATPPHAAAGIRIVDETEVRPGRVRIKASHGTDWAETNDYVLERTGNEWRIASQKPDFSYEPPATGGGQKGGWLKSLFGRSSKEP
jgi:hypothetical protein